MDDALPVLDRIALAVVRLAGGANGSRGGGAWYDVTATDDGHLAIAMGDPGAAPATVSGRLRRAVAGVALGRGSVAALLEELDRAARDIAGSVGGSALCLTLHPSGDVRWSTVGCAPPMAVGPDGVRYLHGGARRDPVGHRSLSWAAHAEDILEAGTTLVVGCSSAEGSTGSVADGPELFGAVGALDHGLGPDAMAAAFTERASGAFSTDRGRTLLFARLMPAPLGQRLPAEPRRLAAVRRAVAVWSGQAALSEDATADLQLLLSEAATNAVEHAYRDVEEGEFVYSVRRRPDGGIRVTVEDFGRWLPPADDPGYRGRGLAVINNIANEVVLDVSGHGTRIAFTVPGDAPVLGENAPVGVAQGWASVNGLGDGSAR